jgi:copper chaperone CopZ
MTINEVGTSVLAITGMTCGSCARTVERALSGVPGVQRATVAVATGQCEAERYWRYVYSG